MKRDRQAGEARLRKDVVTETKHLEVPVTREEVHAVVKEEVRMRKERVTEQRAAEADVRKERVEVEGGARGSEGGIRRDPLTGGR